MKPLEKLPTIKENLSANCKKIYAEAKSGTSYKNITDYVAREYANFCKYAKKSNWTHEHAYEIFCYWSCDDLTADENTVAELLLSERIAKDIFKEHKDAEHAQFVNDLEKMKNEGLFLYGVGNKTYVKAYVVTKIHAVYEGNWLFLKGKINIMVDLANCNDSRPNRRIFFKNGEGFSIRLGDIVKIIEDSPMGSYKPPYTIIKNITESVPQKYIENYDEIMKTI